MIVRPRLQRLSRIYSTNPLVFITFCTIDRNAILANQEVHETFVEFSVRAIEKHSFVGRFLIMPDHLHFFLSLSTESVCLSVWMKALKNSLSKSLNLRGHPAPHWQKGFFDHVLRTEESYSEKWNYMMLNPVRAGLVDSPSKWPYQGEISRLTLSK